MAQPGGRRVEEHDHDKIFIITTISNKISRLVAYFFSVAITCVARNRIMYGRMDVFHVSFFHALKEQTYIDAMSMAIFRKRRWMFLIVTAIYFELFDAASGGIATLLVPITFTRTVPLHGKELDFTSNDPACLAWVSNYAALGQCDWTTFNGSRFTTCLAENQAVDVLEAGRGSILSSIPGHSIPGTFTQLSNNDTGIQFVGSMRGILPNGPNGVAAINSIDPSPISLGVQQPDHLYNYTLDLQGLTSGVSCSYTADSPVNFNIANPSNLSSTTVFVTGSCPGSVDFLANGTFETVYSDHILGFWACQSAPLSDSYTVYLRGGGAGYRASIGNISCTISSAQLATYRVQYTQELGAFNSTSLPISNPVKTSTELITRSVIALSSIVTESQNFAANMVAESVITLGVKSFGLPPSSTDPGYLKLWERLIQGMMEYEVTYIRLIYSTYVTAAGAPPQSCTRPVVGEAHYTTFGWTVGSNVAWELFPITVINLSTLLLLVTTMYFPRRKDRKPMPLFDPIQAVVIDPEKNVHAKLDAEEHWEHEVMLKKHKDGEYGLYAQPKDGTSAG